MNSFSSERVFQTKTTVLFVRGRGVTLRRVAWLLIPYQLYEDEEG